MFISCNKYNRFIKNIFYWYYLFECYKLHFDLHLNSLSENNYYSLYVFIFNYISLRAIY